MDKKFTTQDIPRFLTKDEVKTIKEVLIEDPNLTKDGFLRFFDKTAPEKPECFERACMADKEWPSIVAGERVCIQCPRYAGNQPESK